jgi:lipoprotein-anchoring transpeptidase ErfK/SrfK
MKKSPQKKQSEKRPARAQHKAPGSVAAARKPVPKHWWAIGTVVAAALVVLVWVWGNSAGVRLQAGGQLFPVYTHDETLQQAVANQSAAYRLPVRYPDGSVMAFPLHSVGVKPDPAQTVADLRRAQHAPLQRLMWWRPVRAPLAMHVDSPALGTFIMTQARIVTAEPQNASLQLDGANVTLKAGKPGKAYTIANPADSVVQAAAHLQTAPLKLNPRPIQPAVTAADLKTSKNHIEAVLHQKITLHIGDQTVTPSPGDIAQWLTITPAANGKSLQVGLDAARVGAYTDGLSDGHDNPARNQIVSASGEVLRAGMHGARVTGTQPAADAITKQLLAAKGIDVSLQVELTNFKTVTSPSTSKWIEVDLSTKRMYVYSNNSEVRSFLVSAGAPGTPTVTGRYAIYSKFSQENMFGENVDGSRYFQPNVPWVNYFYADYAIHGNYWRPSWYFGNVNSSHGCVGVTVGDGAWIYNWAPIGTPVVVHT